MSLPNMDHSYCARMQKTEDANENSASELRSPEEPIPWPGFALHQFSTAAASPTSSGVTARRLVSILVPTTTGTIGAENQLERASSTPVPAARCRVLKENNWRDAIARAFSPEQQRIIKAMQSEIDKLRKQNKIKTKQIAHQRALLRVLGRNAQTSSLRSPFNFKPLETEQEVEDLNEKLGTDPETWAKMENWLETNIVGRDINNRLHEAIDLIFSRALFTKCSWTGSGKAKIISLKAQTNILELMKKDARKFGNLPDAFFKSYIQRKAKYAKDRLNISEGKVSGPLRHA